MNRDLQKSAIRAVIDQGWLGVAREVVSYNCLRYAAHAHRRSIGASGRKISEALIELGYRRHGPLSWGGQLHVAYVSADEPPLSNKQVRDMLDATSFFGQ